MKFKLSALIALVVMVGAGSEAMASRAKLLVMGSGEGGLFLDGSGSGGSFFYDTPYNMFYNPAAVNNYNNWAIVEKSNFVETQTGTYNENKVLAGTTTTTIGTTAQGGFIFSVMKFKVGGFFNRVAAVDSYYRNRTNMRPMDLVIGSEYQKVKWGVGATYSSFRGTRIGTGNANDKGSDHDLALRAGFHYMDFEPFVTWKLFGNEATQQPTQKYRDIRIGGRYHYGEWIPAVAFKTVRSSSKQTFRTYGGSLGRGMRIAEGVNLFYSLGWWKRSFNNRQIVPLYVSVEGEATKWLTLRGGFQYSLLNRDNGVSVTDNTNGRIGASITVSGLEFDWAVGKNVASAAEATASTDSQNFDFSDGLFSAASLSYKW